jgi:phosphinothricin acetyltransferase
VKTRDADEADLPAIVAIYNAAIATRMSTAQLEPVTVTERLPWFRKHSPTQHPLWVLEIDETVAGWFSFQPFKTRAAYRGTAEVSVYVEEHFRRRGVGRTLLREAIAKSPSLKINALLGLIFAHNKMSLELFQGFGFERWGLLPRVARMEGIARDIVIVGRHLEDGFCKPSSRVTNPAHVSESYSSSPMTR